MKKVQLVKVVSNGIIFNGMNESIRNGKETKTTFLNISKKVENVKLNQCSDTGNAFLMKVSARLTVSKGVSLYRKFHNAPCVGFLGSYLNLPGMNRSTRAIIGSGLIEDGGAGWSRTTVVHRKGSGFYRPVSSPLDIPLQKLRT